MLVNNSEFAWDMRKTLSLTQVSVYSEG